MHSNKQSNQIPPRRFPKQEYRRQGRRFWIVIIGIIVVILIVVGIFTKATIKRHQVIHHPAKVVRPVHKTRSKVMHHQLTPVKVTPKRGEKLLDHWLIKLNYPTNQAQSVLNRYQRTNQIKDVQFTKALFKINQSSASNKTKTKWVQTLIKSLK